jgi:hypothetical protein
VPSNILATLAIGEGDPPGITLDLRADGHQLSQGTVAPADAVMLADAVGQATGDPSAAAAVKQMFQPVVDALRTAVTQADELQQERKDALAAWEQALGTTP